MKKLNISAYNYFQALTIILIVMFILIAMPYDSIFHFLTSWMFNIYQGLSLLIVIYIVFFSLALTIFEYAKSKRLKKPLLVEKKLKPVYLFILVIFAVHILYMIISSVFSINTYHLMDYILSFVVTSTLLLIIYIPSLFIDIVESNRILSFLYLFFFYLIIHIMLIAPMYISFFLPGV